ncbi:MAG TPA: copper homeostasis protein CutC [Pyrinomonadaceae bacterium]
MSNAILEVIICSVTDAIEAQKGGASRLEVVRDLERGGLTPTIQLVRAIKE